MKKIFKSCLLVLVAVCVSFSFVGCKKKVSPTTTNTENIKSINGVTTNGGMTVVDGEYLYFINGTKANDGKSQNKNKRSAICRVKYDVATGETSGDMEVVVDELVGFTDGSIHIFGDFLYYATPCNGENSAGDVLYFKTEFKRYDLVNKKSYSLYTTELNVESEEVKYAYYVVDSTLNLLVYEKSNATIKSFKIDKKVTQNYEIDTVASCLFADNYGAVTTTGASVDANSFVYYTQTPEAHETPQTGVKVFKTSPVTKNAVKIADGKEIALLSIEAGKLVYSYNNFIYADSITAAEQTLKTENANCISRATLDNAIYLENYKLVENPTKPGRKQLVKAEGHISVLSLTKATDSAHYFNVFEWTNSSKGPEDNMEEIALLTSVNDFAFIGLTKINELVKEDDEDTTDVNEEVKRDVLYAVFTDSSVVYKVEIAEYTTTEGTLDVSSHSEKIQISSTKIVANDGLLIPEINGDYLFVLSQDSDNNNYLVKMNLNITENSTKESSKFALEEK